MQSAPETSGRARILRRDGHIHDLVACGEVPTFLLASLEAELDSLANVGERLLARATLTDAARDHWALCDDPAILARTQHHGKPHERDDTAPACPSRACGTSCSGMTARPDPLTLDGCERPGAGRPGLSRHRSLGATPRSIPS